MYYFGNMDIIFSMYDSGLQHKIWYHAQTLSQNIVSK
jgi:hypothetical protein